MIRLMVVLEATLGGIRKHVLDLLTGLDVDRFEITFVYSRRRADATFLSSLSDLAGRGIRLVEIPMSREVGLASEVRALVQLIGAIRTRRPDVIHLHGAKAGALGRIAARACGVRQVIYTPHGGAFHKFGGIRGAIFLAIEKTLSILCDTFYIGVSKDSCRQIQENLRVPKKRVRLVYNGIDIAAIDGELAACADIRADIDPSGRRFVVLYPAVFLEAKGHAEFIEAIASSPQKLLRDVLIVLAGDGPLWATIRHKIDEHALGDCIAMAGFVRDIYCYYRACDLVILPSRAEVFGYVLLEAMACGKPVLATAVGGIPELVQNGSNGELIRFEDINLIVDRLNRLATHRNLADRYGRAGRALACSSFSNLAMIENSCKIYEELYPLSRWKA